MTELKRDTSTGPKFEGIIAEVLKDTGYAEIKLKAKTEVNKNAKEKVDLFEEDPKEFINFLESIVSKEKYPKGVFVRQFCICKSIYSKPETIHYTKCDFLIYHPDKFPKGLILEAKYQKVGGSVDEKLPYLVESIKKYACDCIVVIEGEGFRVGAIPWLKSKIEEVPQLREVFNLDEFKAWLVS